MRVSFATQPGSSDRPNEDFVAASPTAAVVLDGLTAPGELGTGCTHGTPWYAMQLGTSLLQATTLQVDVPLREIVRSTIRAVADLHRDTCDLGHPGTPSASVVLLRETADTIDYLLIFDSVLLLGAAEQVTMVTDDRVYSIAQREREATRGHLIGTDAHRSAVRELVDAERRHRNKEGGYWVASAIPEVADHSVTGTIDRGQIQSAALLTDGVSCLADTYAVASWGGLLDSLRGSDPATVIGNVRSVEATDERGERWPRYKRSDDATAALCEF